MMIIEKRCKVCNHPYRKILELFYSKKRNVQSVYQRLLELESDTSISIQSLYRHFRNHFTAEDVEDIDVLDEEKQLSMIIQVLNELMNKHQILEFQEWYNNDWTNSKAHTGFLNDLVPNISTFKNWFKNMIKSFDNYHRYDVNFSDRFENIWKNTVD